MNPVITIAAYTVLEASRNRLLWLVFAFMATGAVFAEFIGDVAITESEQTQAAFLGALLRACAVFMVALFVITSMLRDFNDKGVELVLSLPIPRASYCLGKMLGYSAVAAMTAATYSVCLLLYAPPAQTLLWGVSLTCELLIVTAFSVLCLFTFTHVTLALSTVMGFYVLSRSISAFRAIAESPLLTSDSLGQQFLHGFVSGLAYVLPSLERFTLTDWLVYATGTWQSLMPIFVQTVIYLLLIVAAALFDLYRRNL